MGALPLAFGSPWLLLALLALPVIWWLLRLTPPRPRTELFPPLKILARLVKREETPAKSPWWLTLLRLLMAALAILAMAAPVWNPQQAALKSEGPVLVVIDNGWASAQQWDTMRQTALRLIGEASQAGRTVMLAATGDPAVQVSPLPAEEAITVAEGIQLRPLEPQHGALASSLRESLRVAPAGSVFFLSDGLQHAGSAELAEVLSASTGQLELITPALDSVLAMTGVENDPQALAGTLVRAQSGSAITVDVTGFDREGLAIARGKSTFDTGETSATFRFDEPVELRNQIARLGIEQSRSAGAVRLLDDSFRRRLVGMVSGESGDISQPLLSPLYYISKALAPFSDIRQSLDANVAKAVPELIVQKVSAIVMADIGNLPDETVEALSGWISKGGMLIRFAGPRLAAAPEDPLLPVRLRMGDRNLDSALSWETPKPMAPFERSSPFFGLEPPREVLIRRQVLALQEPGLEERTWAVLDDGTPLVTAARRGSGWIVLFHTGSDATWSNLPISGTFVELLRRVVNQSRSNATAAFAQDLSLPPLRLLDGNGELGAAPLHAKPLTLAAGTLPAVTYDNPPGLYGTEDGFVALNLFRADQKLEPLDAGQFVETATRTAYASSAALDLKPAMLALAATLLALDCLAVIWMAGVLRIPRLRIAAVLPLMVMLALGAATRDSLAQESESRYAAALETRLAYVITGDSEVDETSRRGMVGLSQFLASRTALEPGEPVGVDIAADELGFYPLLYWPVSIDAAIPDAATMARVDAFMKQGGSVLFDTRDQYNGLLGGSSGSPEAVRLQAILSSLDIPQLEPVPPDHVLTKSFYLLSTFPGRYAGGDLWVEAIGESASPDTRPARGGDGVSTIMITSNDLAGAWAVDDSLQPLFQTVPPDPAQREYSYRVGVNLMMYVLTGNYKADQVHIPALLERLGQ